MEVSHFELIYKPQSPVGVGGTGPVDTVLQGYFLEITNLEAQPLQFQVAFIAQPPAPGQPLRSLAGNTLVFIDTPGVNNAPTTLAGGFGASRFVPASGLVAIAPEATALVAVVPSAFGASPLDPTPITTPEFEVRGFVRLTLPALRVGPFFLRAQATAPVRVMLTPQNRSVYLRPNGNLSDQTQASLPTASGGAIASVVPEPSRFVFPVALDEVLDLTELTALSAAARPAALVALLAELDDEPESLRRLNKALEANSIPVTVERRARAGRKAAGAMAEQA